MTDLTDKWKKGELPNGWYWCKCYDEETKLLYCDGDSFELDDPETKNYYFFLPKDVAEITILARASYEKWKETLQALDAAHKAIKMEDETINRLVCSGKQRNCENGKLKELLKECKHIMGIEKDFASCHFEKDKLCKLLAKINQALGEDK